MGMSKAGCSTPSMTVARLMARGGWPGGWLMRITPADLRAQRLGHVGGQLHKNAVPVLADTAAATLMTESECAAAPCGHASW